MRTSATKMQLVVCEFSSKDRQAVHVITAATALPKKIVFQALYKRVGEWMDCIYIVSRIVFCVLEQGKASLLFLVVVTTTEEKPCQGETQITKKKTHIQTLGEDTVCGVFTFF
jgi:hypothetical protein